MTLLPIEALEKVVQRMVEEDVNAFYSPSIRGHIEFTHELLVQYLAVYIHIQALQNRPSESDPNHNALRDNIKEALGHFAEVSDKPVPGLSRIELLLNRLCFTTEDENDFNERFLNCIRVLGQWLAGDEKLFKYLGRRANTRLVPHKPGKIGLWIYELCAQLASGLPFLLYFKAHIQETWRGEGYPVSQIMAEWGEIVKKKSNEGKTVLVADSYYLDEAGRAALKELEVPYICAVQAKRFHILTNQAKKHVSKAGESIFLWNKKEHELLAHYYSPEPKIGRKFVLSNAYKKEEGTTRANYLPGCDDFAIMFSTCDHFNCSLVDRTWPHRCSSGTRRLHDFYMTSILLNVMNVWRTVQGGDSMDVSWKDFMVGLADELWADIDAN